MQTRTNKVHQDFALVLPPGESLTTYAILATRHIYRQTWGYSQNRKYIMYCVIIKRRTKPRSRATCTENFWSLNVVLERADRVLHSSYRTWSNKAESNSQVQTQPLSQSYAAPKIWQKVPQFFSLQLCIELDPVTPITPNLNYSTILYPSTNPKTFEFHHSNSLILLKTEAGSTAIDSR